MTATTETLDVSFVIPARNEELLLGDTLQALHQAALQNNLRYEVIVANDASEDRTEEIARNHQAQVVNVKLHNIGAVRNAGAAIAQGKLLFFLDADTQLPAETLRSALNAIEQGVVGGGARVRFENVSLFQHLMAYIFEMIWLRYFCWAAGCCIFVKREIFERINGFDPTYFAAEERYLSDAIKQHGKFLIVDPPVLTSGRKLRIYSTFELLRLAFRTLITREVKLTSPEGLEILYAAPREKEKPGSESSPNSKSPD